MTIICNSDGAANTNSIEPPSGGSTGPRPLEIQAGTQRVPVPASSVRDQEQQTLLIREFDGQQNLVCNLDGILSWSTLDRRSNLSFCSRLKAEFNDIRFVGPASREPSTDLFEIMLASIALGETPDMVERGINGAAEVAALIYPESLLVACNRIIQVIRANNLKGYRVGALVRHASQFIESTHDVCDGDSTLSLAELWPSLTSAGDMVFPTGWTEGEDWILRIGDAVANKINMRIAITRCLRDAGGETSFLELTWLSSGDWRRKIFPKGVLASARSIVQLADYDIAVNSNNAADLIDYLDAFESQNRSLIPEAIVCDKMGWIGEAGADGFLVGRRLINERQPADMIFDGVQQSVEFRGADQGDEQLADSLRPSGSFEQWREHFGLLRTFPKVLLAMYASFIPPLLMIFRSHSFIVSFAGPTSGGKTTTLMCAAATWGCPDQQMPGSIMKTWDTTRVGIERSMRVLDGIPNIIDDTKQARRPEDIAQTVYDVTGGRGKTRGSVLGLAATGTWLTVMITSGEQPMTSFSQDGGTRARILEAWNSPFGQTSEEMAAFVTELREEFCQHYGHAGPRFVSFLIANRARWNEWREQFRESRVSYQRLAGNNNVASRMAAHVAAIEVGARLVHEALQLPWDYDDTLLHLWPELTQDAAEADRAAVSMKSLLN
ncbi:MAG TPA: DUF927 domain-containing protein, partial [Planctomycetaceae bacterium]|nr:DUF927 domain-containing protein [Planctomycetaceae bacterium]